MARAHILSLQDVYVTLWWASASIYCNVRSQLFISDRLTSVILKVMGAGSPSLQVTQLPDHSMWTGWFSIINREILVPGGILSSDNLYERRFGRKTVDRETCYYNKMGNDWYVCVHSIGRGYFPYAQRSHHSVLECQFGVYMITIIIAQRGYIDFTDRLSVHLFCSWTESCNGRLCNFSLTWRTRFRYGTQTTYGKCVACYFFLDISSCCFGEFYKLTKLTWSCV